MINTLRSGLLLLCTSTLVCVAIHMFPSWNFPNYQEFRKWSYPDFGTEPAQTSLKSSDFTSAVKESTTAEKIFEMCTKSSAIQSDSNTRIACKYFIHARQSTQYLAENLEMQHLEDFKFTAKAENVCGDDDIELVIVAHSAAANTDKRAAIRKTWLAEIEDRYSFIRVAFISGESMSDGVNSNVMAEATENSDLIIAEMIDEYHKLTLKHMLLLRWVRDFCPCAKFVMKCDDDIMVNPNAYETLKKKVFDRENATGMMFGRVLSGMKPLRASSKWGMSSAYYPFDIYPDYFLGPAVIIGREAARKILELGKIVPFMGIDDVFINGILPRLGNITTVPMGDLVYSHRPAKPLVGPTRFTWLKRNAEEIENEWNETLSNEARRREEEMKKLEEDGGKED